MDNRSNHINFEYTGAPTSKQQHIFASPASLFTTWHNTPLTHKSLSLLTDRELEDNGLCRGDINAVAFCK